MPADIACSDLYPTVLSTLVQAAVKDRPEGVLVETVKFFQMLVANLDARFLSQQAVNKPLVKLIRHCVGDEDVDSAWGEDAGFEDVDDMALESRRSVAQTAHLNESVVGLMTFVASKLYNAQELLHVFFHDRRKDILNRSRFRGTSVLGVASENKQRPPSPALSNGSSAATVRAVTTFAGQVADARADEAEEARSYDFPLFTFLLRFVHAEGQTGQLARAGLSVIFKIAFETRPLELSTIPRVDPRRVRFTQEADDSSTKLDLAHYILNSDFVDVIGASLGAVYGLLPSKLSVTATAIDSGPSNVPAATSSGGMSLGSNDAETLRAEALRLHRQNIESNHDVHVIERLQLFVDLLDFLQYDVLGRATAACSVDELAGRALAAVNLIDRFSESIRLSLMNNVISSSMVESGDRDGSAVAVMSYLEVLLCTLQDSSPLAEVIIGWLIREEEHDARAVASATVHPHVIQRVKRQKSAALLLLEQGRSQEESIFDPLLHYTIKNLIIDHIAPTISADTVAAALKLANAFLSRHGRFALYGLIDVAPDADATCFPFEPSSFTAPQSSASHSEVLDLLGSSARKTPRSVSLSRHIRERDLYLSLISPLTPSVHSEDSLSESFSTSTEFGNYVKDVEDALAIDSMYQYGLQHSLSGTSGSELPHSKVKTDHKMSQSEGSQAPFRHRLQSKDPLVRGVLSRLRRFFEQPTEVNVPLTGLIGTISLCPYRDVEGWLTFAEAGSESSTAIDPPVLLVLLHTLVGHVQTYRSQIPDFDAFLAERRRGLLYVENLNDALEGLPAYNNSIGTQSAGTLTLVSASGVVNPSVAEKTWQQSVGLSWPGSTTLSMNEDVAQEHKGLSLLDAQVVDARALCLPPRPSDQEPSGSDQPLLNPSAAAESDKSTIDATYSGLLRSSTVHRLFGRSLKFRDTERTHSIQDSNAVLSNGSLGATPFASHYAQTGAISFEPLFVPMPKGRWSGCRHVNGGSQKSQTDSYGHDQSRAREKRTRFRISPRHFHSASQTLSASNLGEELRDFEAANTSPSSKNYEIDSYLAYPGLDDDEQEEVRRTRGRMTLSSLLDNVVVLEEFIKQLVAIIEVRRTMGVESIDLTRT